MFTTAIADDFLTAYARIPRRAQKKVEEFTRKFRENPTSAGINYESLQTKDPRLRSVRIGLDYRAIVLSPEEGNVHVLLWVDHHDEAYRWAKNRMVEVHPSTGALQVFQTIEATEEAISKARQPKTAAEVVQAVQSGRFRDLTDKELIVAGVPAVLLPAVRQIFTDGDLDAIVPHLPEEAGEVLTGIAAGMTLDEALEEVLAAEPAAVAAAPVDTTDVVAALQRPQSGRRFRLMDQDFDLETALQYPFEKWRVFLHPMQKKLVDGTYKGPMRVLGAAGTGKTVVAMHRAVRLVRKLLPGADQRVLFTTFNVNLAADIEEQLAKLASEEELSRIDVVNIDSLASGITKDAGEDLRLALNSHVDEAWREVVDAYGEGPWDQAFYQAEWRDVLQAQGLTTEAEYMNARRIGRGTKLRRIERKKVWPVLERYRELLEEKGLTEGFEILRAARRHLEQQPDLRRYDAVVVDEAQDMNAEALRLIRAIAGDEHANDVFLVGDAHQRIYGRPIPLSRCGINIRGRRSRYLRINYRTTDTIRRFAMRALEGESFDDLDEGTDDAKGYTSLRTGPEPTVRNFDDLASERAFIVSEINKLIETGTPASHICVVARLHDQIDSQYEPALRSAGLEAEKLDQHAPKTDNVRIATMPRVKGLEFPVMFVAGVNHGIVPLLTAEAEGADPVVRRQALQRERCLLYVASSRARDQLYVTSHGTASELIGP